jgi:hypothetical protein
MTDATMTAGTRSVEGIELPVPGPSTPSTHAADRRARNSGQRRRATLLDRDARARRRTRKEFPGRRTNAGLTVVKR